MLVSANQYTDVRAAASVAARTPLRAGKNGTQGTQRTDAARMQILVKKARARGYRTIQEWAEAEMRAGGELDTYLRRERHQGVERQRAVARRMDGFRQNNQSEHQLVAAIPAREFFRWKREDPDFFCDDKNLKSLKRDNPDMRIYL